MDGKAIEQIVEYATLDMQGHLQRAVRGVAERVPGQLFRDIGRFHSKFGLDPTTDIGHRLPDDVLKFRIKFLYEELEEYCAAVGASVVLGGGVEDVEFDGEFNAEQAFDALIDLAYVCLGTAFLHRFPFNEGWDRVQSANMKKVRASSEDDQRSKRKHKADVVKPHGWLPPVLFDLLDEECPECNESGELPEQKTAESIEFAFCGACEGAGRRRRGTSMLKCCTCGREILNKDPGDPCTWPVNGSYCQGKAVRVATIA